MPQQNAQGHLTWNPAVGLYHKPAANERESYGGIVGALQDHIAQQSGSSVKAYPHNFAGIIAAIQDLNVAANDAPVYPDVNPGGGQIIINIDGNPEWIDAPPKEDGLLWFDTRQGRLFVSVDQQWWQTNGADGLAYVTPDNQQPKPDPVVGQFWWDAGHSILYIFDGFWYDADGNIESHNDGNSTPIWRVVNQDDQSALQTTATLPLSTMGPRISQYEVETPEGILPSIEPTEFHVQKDYNEWIFKAFLILEQFMAGQSVVSVGEDPPDEPKQGDLWYDTEALDMSIWYVEPGDDVTEGQWVPSAVAYNYDKDLDVIRSMVLEETTIREQQLDAIRAQLVAFDQIDNGEIAELQSAVVALGERITAEAPDLGPYAVRTDLSQVKAELLARIAQIPAPQEVDLTPYATTSALNTQVYQLNAAIGQRATNTQLQQAIAEATAADKVATPEYVQQQVATVSSGYLPRGGGELTGSFTMVKEDYSAPVFDFSAAPHYGHNALKFQTSPETTTVFGTTEAPFELAWQFGSDEDYSWIYNSHKVFSISKEGPACSTLILGDFGVNDVNGRVIHNRIDLKERLTAYQTAFESLRQGVATSTDFESLKANILSALASV